MPATLDFFFLICPAAALLKQTHLQTCKNPEMKTKDEIEAFPEARSEIWIILKSTFSLHLLNQIMEGNDT